MRVLGAALLAGILTSGAAHAQTIERLLPPGVVVASDIDAPYDDVGPPPPRYAPPIDAPRTYPPPPPVYGPPDYGPSAYAPPVLSPGEIVRIARGNGYSPLGTPQQRGLVYTITVIDLDGADGRLVVDARNGRIIRFVPAYRFGARGGDHVLAAYGPAAGLPPIGMGPPSLRPPASIPRARAAVPLPKPMPRAASVAPDQTGSIAAQKPAQAKAAIPPAPTAALAAAPSAPAPAAIASPGSAIQPTQSMPNAQGLD